MKRFADFMDLEFWTFPCLEHPFLPNFAYFFGITREDRFIKIRLWVIKSCKKRFRVRSNTYLTNTKSLNRLFDILFFL